MVGLVVVALRMSRNSWYSWSRVYLVVGSLC